MTPCILLMVEIGYQLKKDRIEVGMIGSIKGVAPPVLVLNRGT